MTQAHKVKRVKKKDLLKLKTRQNHLMTEMRENHQKQEKKEDREKELLMMKAGSMVILMKK